MACESCTDKTFRVRVKCTPCGPVSDSCCPSPPKSLCLSLSGATVCGTQLNGKRILMTWDENTVPAGPFNCCSPFTTSGLQLPYYTGSFALSPTAYTNCNYGIQIGCCPAASGFGFFGHIALRSCSGDPSGIFNSCLNYGVLGYKDLTAPCGVSQGTDPGTVVCSPFQVTGTFGLYDLFGTLIGTVNFTAVPVPAEGCGGGSTSGTCCDNELGTHPPLSVGMTGSCSAVSSIGLYTAVWNGTAWQFGPTGSSNYIWFLNCPTDTITNRWTLRGQSAVDVPYTLTAQGGCNPANVIFTGTCGLDVLKVSVTL